MPFDLTNPILEQLLIALAILLVAFILSQLGKRLVPRYVDDPARQYRISKFISRIVALLAVVTIIALWSPGLKDVLTLLTVVGAGLAIAMRETVLSLFGRLNIAVRHPFKHSDRIEVNGIHGDVIDIRLFHTTLMEIRGWVDADQSTGRIVHVPNYWVFLHGVHNYTRGFKFIWNEIPVTITFRSDWKAAREIMLSFAQESAEIVEQQAKQEIHRMSREYLIHYSILSPFVYVKIVENGTRLTLRYLCEARKRRGTAHALTVSILDAFKEHGGIEFAYPMVGVTEMEPPQFGPLPGPTSRPSEKKPDDT